MIITPKVPFGHVIFCDDVREEVSNKFTLVGVYAGSIFVSGQSPFVLPLLCCHVTIILGEEGLQAGGRLQLRKIRADGWHDTLAMAELPEIKPSDVPEAITIAPDSIPNITMNATLRMNALPVEEDFTLRAVLLIGEDEYRLGGINVQIAPEGAIAAEA